MGRGDYQGLAVHTRDGYSFHPVRMSDEGVNLGSASQIPNADCAVVARSNGQGIGANGCSCESFHPACTASGLKLADLGAGG